MRLEMLGSQIDNLVDKIAERDMITREPDKLGRAAKHRLAYEDIIPALNDFPDMPVDT